MSDDDKQVQESELQAEQTLEDEQAALDDVIDEETAMESGKPPAAAAQEHKPRSGGSAVGMLALLVAIMTAAAVGWLWHLSQQEASMNQQRAVSLQADIARAEQDRAALLARLEQNIVAQQQAQTALQESFKALHEEIGRDRGAWAAAETIYYLELANARLQLLQDVPTALQALLLADARLQAFGDPAYVPVREQLAKEIAALRAVPQPDLTGNTLLLGGLAAQIPNLPLHAPANVAKSAADSAAASETTSDAEDQTPRWQQEAKKIWAVMRELVQVRRTDKRIEPLLHPDEQRLLVANLQLQLQTARFAVLTRDTALLRDSVNTARDWLVQYYDQDAAATRAVIERLDELARLELAPTKPDISGALRLLRSLVNKEKPAA